MNSYQALSAYYDRFTDDVGYADWADFFERLFAREGIQPKLVLDLACGTGSLTRILAERGYEMIGADASPEMLMQAMQNTMDCEPRPLFLNQRMEALDLYGTVDACLCCLDSINYVTEPQTLQKAFERVHLFLEPKSGLFVFDINTPEKFACMDGNAYVREDEDVFCVWQAAVEDSLCAYQFDIFAREGGKWTRAQETHEERIYTVEQLTDMLEKAGFSEIKTYGDQSFAPVRGGEDRIYFTARKRD
ncbi:class I SAM-dependent DNA methyltransferase [Agathobaculum sp.]|uniref:class I SAM-dependent DNA methyltransferase n=1 Tax=Agathobaculum sp. TaxID=2048138 RepID=UPI0027B947C9|nr:class I SAM-dependent methyltransferase [Agathobaculum sp.]